MKFPRIRIGRILDDHGRLNLPFIWVAAALSILLHAATLFGWKLPHDVRQPSSADGSQLTSPLRLRVLPAPPATPEPPAIARNAPPPSRRPAPAPAPPQRPRAPVIALNTPTPGAPAAPVTPPPVPAAPAAPAPAPIVPQPPAPPAPARPSNNDFMAALEARRRARGNNAPSAPPSQAALDNDKARRDSIVASNLGIDRGPSFGQETKKPGGGVFQIRSETFDRAELLFFGWNKDIGRNTAQVVEVRRGNNPNIRMAVIRKMIALIRENESGDFEWESQRLGRILNLSARPADNEGLEEVLMREFYEVKR